MRRTFTRIVVLALAAGAVLALSAGPATAARGKPARAANRSALLAAAAAYIGVTQAEIRTAKQAGQTLAQLAVAKGKSVQGLTAALVAAGTASIDKALADNRITAERAAAQKAALPAQVTAFINGTGGAGGCAGKAAGAARQATGTARTARR